MSAYISQNLTLTIYDCVDAGNCTTTVTTISNDVAAPPAAHVAAIHKALQSERTVLDKRAIMIPTSEMEHLDTAEEGKAESKSSTITTTSSTTTTRKDGNKKQRLHFCHQPEDQDNEKAYLERYHCGFNRINVCHFNGKEFTTMCVKAWSTLFRNHNMDPADYCGICRNKTNKEPPQKGSGIEDTKQNNPQKIIVTATY